jgi:hypothetical protein
MATISATCKKNLLPVDLRRPPPLFQQLSPAGRRWLVSAPPNGGASTLRCEQQQQRRGARHGVVPAAAMTETQTSVVGDMERGSLAESSGRSDGQLTARWREIHGSNDWEGLLDPIDTVLHGELIRYGEFAQACYDAFDYDRFSRYCGTSRYPPGSFFRDVGLDGVGYEVTRYLYATSTARLPNFNDQKHKSDDPDARLWSETASIGFVAVSSDREKARIGRRDIAVAWRGTVTCLE